MKKDRRVPLSCVAYQAAEDRAGDIPLSDFVSAIVIQFLQPISRPASVPTVSCLTLTTQSSDSQSGGGSASDIKLY